MYKEDLEGFERTEKAPRTYVSTSAQTDVESLLRENERLKKNLEKEKFFNKLLDNELKDLKAEITTRLPAEYIPAHQGVSRGAFYTVLFFALALAGVLLYTLYTNQSNAYVQTPAEIVQENNTNTSDESNVNTSAIIPSDINAGREKDSVSIIAGNTNAVPSESSKVENKNSSAPHQSVQASNNKTEEYNEAAVEAFIRETPPKKQTNNTSSTAATPPSKPVLPAPVVPEKSSLTTQTAVKEKENTPPPISRPVVGKYKVTSKANFYNNADENTLRSAFISGGSNKTVEALEDKNGFIFVEYKNDNGLLSRGWLSKTDLTKID